MTQDIMLKDKKELISECALELEKMPKEEVVKFLYMAQGVAIVSENNTKASWQ